MNSKVSNDFECSFFIEAILYTNWRVVGIIEHPAKLEFFDVVPGAGTLNGQSLQGQPVDSSQSILHCNASFETSALVRGQDLAGNFS